MGTSTAPRWRFAPRFSERRLFVDDDGRVFYLITPTTGIMLSVVFGEWILQPLPDARRMNRAPAGLCAILRDALERELKRLDA